jgi:CCR4-NOT transcriptional complex subunit CAF120
VQLVGTILSLWDASALDQAGGDAEVLPIFINLTDASIHMVSGTALRSQTPRPVC